MICQPLRASGCFIIQCRSLAHVHLDNATSNYDSEDVYQLLEQVIAIMKNVVSLLLHIRLFAHVIGTSLNDGGPVFLALCMLPPFMRHFVSSDLWTKGMVLDLMKNSHLTDQFALCALAYLVNATNPFYVRKSALDRFVGDDLKQEVIAGGMDNYLLNGSSSSLVASSQLT